VKVRATPSVPERVREDVLDGYVTLERARTEYGVALDPNTLELDAAETATRGKARSSGWRPSNATVTSPGGLRALATA